MKRITKSYWLPMCAMLGALRAEPTPKPPEPPPELPVTGVNLARPAGGWINVEVTGHRFVLRFFDAGKIAIPADRSGGVVRYVYTSKEDKAPAPLARAEDGQTLVSPARIRPPHVFHVHIVLRSERPGEPDEAYNFRYPG
ncbi:MAG: hypothetical protein ACOZE5_14525 [Verrucomicrobiota bacterium]